MKLWSAPLLKSVGKMDPPAYEDGRVLTLAHRGKGPTATMTVLEDTDRVLARLYPRLHGAPPLDPERSSATLRVVIFTLVMLEIVVIPPALVSVLTGIAKELAATLLFFLSFGLIYAAVVLCLRWEDAGSPEDLGLHLDTGTLPHLLIGGTAGTAAAGLVIACAIMFGGTLRDASEITAALISSELIITAPVAMFEELAYRGYLMTRMERLLGPTRGLVGASIIFSLLHFTWWLPLGSVPAHLVALFTLNLALGGIVLGLGYHMSGDRLWLPVGFHFAWNMLAYVVFPVFPRDPATGTPTVVYMPELFQIEWGVTTLVAFLFGLILMWLLMRTRGHGVQGLRAAA